MMSDDKFEVFVRLKFNGLQDVIDRFRTAIDVPHWADVEGIESSAVITVLDCWVEAGAP